MRTFPVLLLLVLSLAASAFSQHEYAPIQRKQIEYKDWTYKNASGEGKTNLRDFAKGKKLVLVFYFAPWCHSSRYEAPVLQRFYDEYTKYGLGIIGISNYGSEDSLRYELKSRKLTFPVVVETTDLSARETSQHYKYRWSTGDHRKWGTPWNIFLFPADLESKGSVVTQNAFVANGELVEDEAEKFIREHLGLPPLAPSSEKKAKKKEEVFEECKPDGQGSGAMHQGTGIMDQ